MKKRKANFAAVPATAVCFTQREICSKAPEVRAVITYADELLT